MILPIAFTINRASRAKHKETSADAGWELVRALHSDDPDVVLLATTILEQTIGSPAISNLAAVERPVASQLG
jgi:hypothetical protein